MISGPLEPVTALEMNPLQSDGLLQVGERDQTGVDQIMKM